VFFLQLSDAGVIERCIGFLCSIASTGIENRMFNTRIIISNEEDILSKTVPVIMDPTRGFGPNRPNIFAKNFFPTFKNWAMLTGCICLDLSGNVVGVGRDIPGIPKDLKGNSWGIRTSARFPCVVIEVVNKDHIMIYKNGTIVMEIKNEKKIDMNDDIAMDI
jgi:hypothetical protein